MRVRIRFFIIAGLMFGLLASLAYPVSPVPTTAAPSLPPILQEPLQIIQPQYPGSPPSSWMPPPSSENSSNSTARINVSSSGFAPLVEDSILFGPHVTFNGTWDPLDVPGLPTLKIKQTCLEFLQTVWHENYGTITHPVLGGWNPDHNPREDYDYVYLFAGSNVYIEVEFGTWNAGEGSWLSHGVNDDIDLFVWPPGVEHTYNNSLVGSSTACCANPETGTFVAPVNGTYTIGLDYYSGVVPMGWRVYVYCYRALGGRHWEGRSAIEDSAEVIGFNGNFDVRLRLITGTSLDADDSFTSHVIPNVTIINFFPPNVTVLHPGANSDDIIGPSPVTISWNGSDPNTDEALQYTVEVSNDLGKTWKTIAYTTENSIVWDPTSAFYGLPPTPRESDGTIIPNFLVRVNVTDGQYNASDTSDHPWILQAYGEYPSPGIEPIFVIIIGMAVVLLVVIDISVFLNRRTRQKKKIIGDSD